MSSGGLHSGSQRFHRKLHSGVFRRLAGRFTWKNQQMTIRDGRIYEQLRAYGRGAILINNFGTNAAQQSWRRPTTFFSAAI